MRFAYLLQIMNEAKNAFNAGRNIVVLGAAGTGKTHFCLDLLAACEKVKCVRRCAASGIAANRY